MTNETTATSGPVRAIYPYAGASVETVELKSFPRTRNGRRLADEVCVSVGGKPVAARYRFGNAENDPARWLAVTPAAEQEINAIDAAVIEPARAEIERLRAEIERLRLTIQNASHDQVRIALQTGRWLADNDSETSSRRWLREEIDQPATGD